MGFEACLLVYWFWGLLGGTLMQVNVRYDQSWATSYELQSNLQIVAVYAGSWEHLGGVKLYTKDSLHQYRARGQGRKGSRHLKICLHLPVAY